MPGGIGDRVQEDAVLRTHLSSFDLAGPRGLNQAVKLLTKAKGFRFHVSLSPL